MNANAAMVLMFALLAVLFGGMIVLGPSDAQPAQPAYMGKPDVVTVLEGRRCVAWRVWAETQYKYLVKCVNEDPVVVTDYMLRPLSLAPQGTTTNEG